jgi:3-oxoacyl-[acyl-carrier protein] reductase
VTSPKLALIAGGSGGVGGAISRALAEDGWDVSLTYRNGRERAESVVATVAALGREATMHQVELTDPESVSAWVSGHSYRSVDAVIYAAGPHVTMNYIGSLDSAVVKSTFENDVLACFHVIQSGLPALRESRGTFLATVSPAVERHMKRDILSASPKAAIEAMVRAVAVEYGRFGVRSNAIGVGLLEGEGMWTELVRNGDFTPESLAAGIKEIPLGRWGDVKDIAEAAKFLVSDRATWISGQTLSVDGGYSA